VELGVGGRGGVGGWGVEVGQQRDGEVGGYHNR
jgi:hypothetical protein